MECTALLEKLRQIPDGPHDTHQASLADSTVLPFQQIGQYELLERIAGGGMGEVFKARQQKLGSIVAIKLLHRDRMADRQLLDRFEQEMQAVGRLNHEHIVRPLYADEQNGVPYLVLEYVEGKTLAALLEEFTAVGEKFLIPLACEVIRQAAIGLQHAHDHGIIHRDIKPSNLMLCRRSAGLGRSEPMTLDWLRSIPQSSPDAQPLIKILDLGLARLNEPVSNEKLTRKKELTREGQVMGTPDYMAPEQLENSRLVDARTDIYALGATLFKLLTGQTPHADAGDGSLTAKLLAISTKPPPSLRELRTDVPSQLDVIVQRALSKSANNRPQTAREFADLLAPFSEIDANAKVFRPHVTSPNHRTARLAILIGAICLLVVVGFMVRKSNNKIDSNEEGSTRTEHKTLTTSLPAVENNRSRNDSDGGPPSPLDAQLKKRQRPTGMFFDGANSYVQIMNLNYQGETDLTIECRATPYKDVFSSLFGNTEQGGLGLGIGKNKNWTIVVGQGDGLTQYVVADSTQPIQIGKEVHLAGVFDHKSVKLFVDGQLQSTQVWKGPWAESLVPFWIGADPCPDVAKSNPLWRAFHGWVDELRVSSVARYSENFVPSLRFDKDDQTLLLMHFDEGAGPVVYDHSGRHNHGRNHRVLWNDPDREVAEWVLQNGGLIGLLNRGGLIKNLAELPTAPFTVSSIVFQNLPKFTEADSQRLPKLSGLVNVGFGYTTLHAGSIKALAKCEKLQGLHVEFGSTAESTFSEVLHVPQLRDIGFVQTAITNDTIGRLGELNQLLNAQIFGCPQVTENGIIQLAANPPPKLRSIHLGMPKIDRAVVRALSDFPHLQDLTIGGQQLAEDAFSELSRASSLSYLALSFESGVSQSATTELQKELAGCQIWVTNPELAPPLYGPSYSDTIRQLMDRGFDVRVSTNDLAGSTWFRGNDSLPKGDIVFAEALSTISEESFGAIKEHTDLRLIAQLSDLRGLTIGRLPPDGLRDLLPLANLNNLWLAGPLTAADLSRLLSFPKLSELQLEIPNDAALETIVKLPHLSRLVIQDNSKLSGNGLKTLESVRTLSTVDLGYSSTISREAAQALANARPDVIVIHQGHRLDAAALK